MIEFCKVSVEESGKQVLNHVEFKVKEGDFFALCGSDDAGKTTLLHVLMGFHTAYTGKVYIMGTRPNNLNAEQRSKVRFVPDDIIWDRQLTAEDYFSMAREAAVNYDSALQKRLCDKYDVPIYNKLLSMSYKGNKLVQIIAAICARPRLLILDEPKNFLDRKSYKMVLEDLRQMNRSGTTILLAAEKYSDVEGYCTYYAYLKEGELVSSGKLIKRTRKCKIVTVRGGNVDFLEKHMERCISERRGEKVFLYKGDSQMLFLLLYKADCEDCTVEDMTLEEELDRNFDRWL